MCPSSAKPEGYTFRRAGVHRLWVEFEVGDGVLHSNMLEVFVKPEYGADPLRDHARRYLSNPRMATVLFHREDLPDGKGLRALNKYVKSSPKIPSAAEINYTLARASLSRAEQVGKTTSALYRQAADWLKQALDCDALGPHCQHKAQTILESLPRARRHRLFVRKRIDFKQLRTAPVVAASRPPPCIA
jgi:hypothetical protein